MTRSAWPWLGRGGLIAALVLAFTGCQQRPCPTLPHGDVNGLLESYRDMRRPARVLRAQARVDRRGGDSRIRGTVMMFIERPDRVRFEATTQFGPAAVLTSDGETFALMDLQENRFLHGPTCPSNIERLLGLHFDGAEVTRLLLGETPRLPGEAELAGCRDGGYLVIIRGEDGRRQELDYEVRAQDIEAPPAEQRLRLRRSEVFDADGHTEWRVVYEDWRFVEDPRDTATPRRGVAMPFVVTFLDPRRGTDTEVRFSAVDLNVDPPPGAFEQRTRRGLTDELVSCDE